MSQPLHTIVRIIYRHPDSMATPRYRDQPDVERQFVRQELIKGWLLIATQVVALLCGSALGIVAIVHGSATLEAGSAGVVAGMAAACSRNSGAPK
jgi:hypothetical protein